MSREIRRVPLDYQHPREWDSYRRRIEFLSLYPGERFASDMADFKANPEDWEGRKPRFEEYMPDFTGRDDLGYCMYETTSEGSPISPVFATPEEVARWLADNDASAFGSDTATYEQWLSVCLGGWAPSAVYSATSGLQSGVAAFADEELS